MSDNIIEFSAPKIYTDLKEDYPEPIKVNIPDWFKNLKHEMGNLTIKGCIPFLETLTTGYLLKMPQDLWIKHNVTDEEGKKNTWHKFGLAKEEALMFSAQLNLNTSPDLHAIEQLGGTEGGCPFIKQNKNLPFYKIYNPWFIKTPPGYSCLFTPPLNNSDDRFKIISGIVQTDTFTNEINFPIVLNGDKYPVLETLIKKGTPYVQVIPFKRDDWKMIVKEKDMNEKKSQVGLYFRNMFRIYQNRHWKKTKWS